MRKIFFPLVAVVLLAIGLVSCNTNTPKATADKFLTSFYHMDYKEAKTVSTEETKKTVDMIEQFSTMIPDSVKANAKKIKIDIKDVQEKGDRATVTYATSESETDSKLELVKVEGKWLVEFDKENQGLGETDEEPMMEEEPMMNDTSMTAGPDTATSM